jgi:hypothetical protein
LDRSDFRQIIVKYRRHSPDSAAPRNQRRCQIHSVQIGHSSRYF